MPVTPIIRAKAKQLMSNQSTANTTAIGASSAATSSDKATVTAVTHWTDNLFSFSVQRPPSFRFRSGEFVMIGLEDDTNKPVTRAYSIASPNWDDKLSFYSIIVPDGKLTSQLRHIKIGDDIILWPKTTGTLVLDRLRGGKRLYLIASGTGFAPFAALIRDPETYDRFDQIIVTHTCRTTAELGYSRHIIDDTFAHPFIGEMALDRLHYFPTVTREAFAQTGRITDHLRTGSLFTALDMPQLDAASDRVMVCGSLGLNHDVASILQDIGLREGTLNNSGEYVIERAFVGNDIANNNSF